MILEVVVVDTPIPMRRRDGDAVATSFVHGLRNFRCDRQCQEATEVGEDGRCMTALHATLLSVTSVWAARCQAQHPQRENPARGWVKCNSSTRRRVLCDPIWSTIYANKNEKRRLCPKVLFTPSVLMMVMILVSLFEWTLCAMQGTVSYRAKESDGLRSVEREIVLFPRCYSTITNVVQYCAAFCIGKYSGLVGFSPVCRLLRIRGLISALSMKSAIAAPPDPDFSLLKFSWG